MAIKPEFPTSEWLWEKLDRSPVPATGVLAGIGRKVSRRIRRLHPANRYPDMVGALSDDFPRFRYLLRLESVAFLLGDYVTAVRAARRRSQRGDPQSLYISHVSEWSRGSDAQRQTIIERALASRNFADDDELTAITRFFIHLERPKDSAETLQRITEPTVQLIAAVGSLWRRHGDPAKAADLLCQARERNPSDRGIARAQEEVAGESAVVEWSWIPKPKVETTRAGGAHVPDRILHIVARSLPHHHAGSTYRTHYTVAAQRRSGLDAHVVTECGFPNGFVSIGEARPAEIYEDIKYLRLPEGPPNGRLDFRLRHHLESISELVASMGPAILHPHSDYRNAAVAVGLRERFGIPVVYEVRGFPEEYLPRRPASRMLYERFGTRRRIEAECWRRADRVVTLAEVMKEHIASKGVDPERIHVVPNAVDAERFTPAPRDEALAAQLGIEPGDAVLGYVSSLTAPYEGIRYLIEAVVQLTRKGKSTRALIVGEGSERPHLMELARRLGVADRIIFTGRVDHNFLPSHYSLIDVFVVPRTMEATTDLVTPLKPLEAMAMERPVVVSGTRALREMIVEGETGLSYEPDNVDSLVAVVESLLGDPDRRREMGRTARQWVIDNRSWSANAELYREIYASLGVTVG